MKNATSVLLSTPGHGAVDTTTILSIDPYVNYPHKISDLGYTVIASLLTFVWVFGTIFSALSLVVFATNKNLRSPTNMFVMSLNVCDLCMSFIGTFPAMTSSWSGRWLYGRLGCTIEGFIVYFLGLTSLYLLCAISADRYVVIAKPLMGSKINHKVAGVCIGFCWLGGFLWSAFPLIGWNEYVLEGAGVSCSVVWEQANATYSSYIFAIFVFCFVLPLVVIIFSYHGVFMTIRNMSRNQNWDKNSRIAKRNMRVEKKMAKSIAVMLTGFLGCWVPYAVVSFIVVFQGPDVVSPEMAAYPAIIAKSQGIFNPLLYVASNKQFRMAFYGLLPCSGLSASLVKREEDKLDSDSSDDDEDEEDNKATKKDSKKKDDKKKVSSKNKVAPVIDDEDKDDENTVVEVFEGAAEDQVDNTQDKTATANGTMEVVELKESAPGPSGAQ